MCLLFIAQNETMLFTTCLPALPLDSVPGDSGTSITVDSCRYLCTGYQYQIAYVQVGMGCHCSKSFSANGNSPVIDVMLAPSCDSSQWMTYWSSHFNPNPNYDLGVLVSVENDILFTGESVALTLSINENATNFVIFDIDFGDGQKLITNDYVIEHTWLLPKQYNVTVVAYQFLAVGSDVISVQVIEKLSPSPPTNIYVLVETDEYPLSVNIFAECFSNVAMNCTLTFGDGDQSLVSTGHGGIADISVLKKYSIAGCYEVTWMCTNTFGTTLVAKTAYAVDSVINIEELSEIENFQSSYGSEFLLNYCTNLALQINLTQINAPLPLQLSLSEGAYVAELTANNNVLSSNVVIVRKPIGLISITLTSGSARPGKVATFQFSIENCDEAYISIQYGDNFSKDLMLVGESCSAPFSDNHTYMSTGQFVVSMAVANDVSFAQVSKIIVVESAITQANLTVSNVTALTQPVRFVLNIITVDGPALYANASFSFGDGTEKTSFLSALSLAGGLFEYYHSYNDWGIYKIDVTLNNGFGQRTLSGIVQVGENITIIDVAANNIRVLTGVEVVFSIYVPYGSPVILELDLGDGNNLTKVISNNFTNSTNAVLAPSSGCQTPTNSDIAITYVYLISGKYTVHLVARNQFSRLEMFHAPQIVVIDSKNSQSDSCNDISMSYFPTTSPSSPFLMNRSSKQALSTNNSLSCARALPKNTLQLYTWYAKRSTSCSDWRTVSQISWTNTNLSTLYIGPNILWYGLYAVNVTTSLSDVLMPQAQATFYVQVVPSPLSISIVGGTNRTMYAWQSLTVEINVFDPDVDANNFTGLNMFVFCYSKRLQSSFMKQSLDSLLANSVRIVNNSLATVSVFEAGNCWNRSNKVWVAGFADVSAPASDIMSNSTVVFDVIVTKDTRYARAYQEISVLATNASTPVTVSFNALADLIRRGDTSAALTILDSMTSSLNAQSGNGSNAQSEVIFNLANYYKKFQYIK